MADISLCSRDDCSTAPLCRRHEASGTAPHAWQSWFAPTTPGPDCLSFWPTGPAAERLADATPASLPNSDASAAPSANASDRNRPVGPLRSGRHPTGNGATHP